MKTALITGAGGGVGRALAKSFHKEGYNLVLTDRDQSDLESLAADLTSPVELVAGDLRNDADLSNLSARLQSETSPVDVLINNAGIIVPGAVSDIAEDQMLAHVDINLTAPMILSAAAARAMKHRRRGHILSIVSLAGIVPMKNSAAYSASKFGMRGFKAALSMELKPYGIGVGSIFPGAIDTPMLEKEMACPEGSPMNFVAGGGPSSPEDVAEATLKAMKTEKLETWIPKGEGRSGGLVMTFPSLLAPISSHLEKKGEKKKAAYLAGLSHDR